MADPIGYSLNRENALKALGSKYGPSGTQFSTSPLVTRALQNYDASRANLGQSPLSKGQTIQAGKALGTLSVDHSLPFLPATVHADAATPAPDRPWWQDATSDISQILTAVPKIPALIMEEGTRIPSIPGAIRQAGETARNPLEAIGNYAQVPGIRMLPGSFVASQFGTGGQGIGGLTEHPVMSALDVLPYAEKGASLTKTATLAKSLAESAATLSNTLPRRTTPLGSVLKYGRPSGPIEVTRPRFAPYAQVGGDVQSLKPNVIGAAMERVSTALLGSGNPISRAAGPAFSPVVRDLMQQRNRRTADLEALGTTEGYVAPGLTTDVTNLAQNQAATEAANRVAVQSAAVRDAFHDIPEARQRAIQDDLELNSGRGTGLSDREQQYADAIRPLQEDFTRNVTLATGKFQEVQFDQGPEIYDTPTALRIKAARHTEEAQAAVQNLRAHLDPRDATNLSPTTIHADMTRALTDPAIKGKTRLTLARGYLAAMDAAGVDRTVARDALSATPNKATIESLPGLVNPAAVTPVAHTLESIAAALDPLARKSLPVNRFLTAMKRGDDTAALAEVSAMKGNRAVNDILTASNIDLSTDLTRARDIRRATSQARSALESSGFTDRATTLAQRGRARIEAANPPDRFQRLLQSEAKPRMAAEVNAQVTAGNIDAATADRVLDQITHDLFKDARESVPELRAIQAEVRDSWQQLAARGDDPVFVSHIAPSKLPTAAYPQVADHVTSPGQFRKRLWDAGPTYSDVGVALNVRALEYLTEQGNRAFLQGDVARTFTRTYADLRNEFLQDAIAASDGTATNVEAHLMAAIEKSGMRPFDPESFITGRTVPAGKSVATSLFVPAEIAKALSQVSATPSDLARVLDAPMNVFRTSVLPLSPRWHVNNIVGGLITTSLRAENPLTIWKHLPDAIRMAKGGGPESLLNDTTLTSVERDALRNIAPGGSTRQASEWFRNKESRATPERLTVLNKYAAGRTLRRLYDKAVGSVQTSYNFNQVVDDMYRSMAYLEGSDRALTRGMSRAESIRAGVSASRDMLQNWDTLTPIERSTMRMVFPFYSWTRFMMKYVLTYPGDHPWRTSIMASLSRTEGHDLGSGLPQDLRTLLFFGDPDQSGNIRGVSTAGFNPFRDTANYFTLLGFMGGGQGDISAVTSQVNPAFSTLLQWAGVDPASGSADLYPELQYDPATGRLIATPKQNPILGAVGNFLPQFNALTALGGVNAQYRDLMKRDPAAAARYLESTVGAPILSRDVNLNDKVISGDVTRYNALKDDLSASLKAGGDLSGFASRYPALAGMASRLNTLAQTPDFQRRYGFQTGMAGTYNPSAEDIAREAGRAILPYAS